MVVKLDSPVEHGKDAIDWSAAMDVSIIIPTYKRPRLLELTLASLVEQETCGFSFEVIVINDGATEETTAITGRFAEPCRTRCVCIDHDGFRISYLRNRGVAEASGRILVFLDSGMLVKRDFVYQHARLHQTTARSVAVVGGLLAWIATNEDAELCAAVDGVPVDQAFERVSAMPRHGDLRDIAMRSVHRNPEETALPWAFFWAANVSIERKVFHEVGGFDERFRSWGGEDIELGYRFFERGVVFLASAEAAAIHYPHERDLAGLLRANVENDRYFYEKHRTAEIEYLYCGRGPRLCEQSAALLANDPRRIAYAPFLSDPVFASLGAAIRPGPALLVGAHDGALLDVLDCEAAVEHSRALFDELSRKRPRHSIMRSLGVLPRFPQRAFEHVVMTEAVHAVTDLQWLTVWLRHLAEIGRTIHVFIACDVQGRRLYQYPTELLERAAAEVGLRAQPAAYECGNSRLAVLRLQKP